MCQMFALLLLGGGMCVLFMEKKKESLAMTLYKDRQLEPFVRTILLLGVEHGGIFLQRTFQVCSKLWLKMSLKLQLIVGKSTPKFISYNFWRRACELFVVLVSDSAVHIL